MAQKYWQNNTLLNTALNLKLCYDYLVSHT